jgi:hypothetical protein
MATLSTKQDELRQLVQRANTLRGEIQLEKQERLQARLNELTPHQKKVLGILFHGRRNMHDYDYVCLYRRTIEEDAHLTNMQVGRALGALRRLGFAAYHRGLMTEDNQVAGSGYCITEVGTKWWTTVEEPST